MAEGELMLAGGSCPASLAAFPALPGGYLGSGMWLRMEWVRESVVPAAGISSWLVVSLGWEFLNSMMWRNISMG